MVTAAISVVNRVKHFVASMLGSSDGMNPMEHPEDILFIPPVVDEGILRLERRCFPPVNSLPLAQQRPLK